MSYVIAAPSKSTSKVVRLSKAVRKSWTDARYADRQLMAMRTHLTSHAGC
jgi:hypothetical protein